MKEFRTVDEVLEFAIAKEVAANRFYHKLAQEEAEHKLRLEIEYDLTTF